MGDIMKKKKIVSIIILALLLVVGLFVLTGCSDIFSTNNTTNTTNTSKYNTTETKTYSTSNISTVTSTSNTTAVNETKEIETTYILNKNTKKFHYPSCSSVRQMKDSNKRVYEGSRDDVIGMGYTPCQRCCP
jgi:uncharacterized protein YceK